MTLEDAKVLSEIVSNYASPIATVAAAFIAVLGAKQITEKVIEARGAGVAVQAQPPTGTATGTSTSAASSAPQASVTVTPDKK